MAEYSDAYAVPLSRSLCLFLFHSLCLSVCLYVSPCTTHIPRSSLPPIKSWTLPTPKPWAPNPSGWEDWRNLER